MPTETVEQLKKCFLFSDLPDHTLEFLAEKTSSRSLSSGEVLFKRGEIGDSLFMITDGFLNIAVQDNKGDTLILNQCGPGETIGEMSLLDKEPRSASVIARTNANILELRQEAFFELLQNNHETALELIRNISTRLRFANIYLEKAILWSGKVATGDYSLAMEDIQISRSSKDSNADYEEKAGQLLTAFVQMVEGVKARETKLKEEIQKLNFEIDQTRRKEEFEELTGSEFYTNLKEQAQRLREERAKRTKHNAKKTQEDK